MERFFVEEAAKALGKKWSLGPEDRENPDFVVAEDGNRFGLEVVEIFSGDRGQRGSRKKRDESENQKAVSALRKAYEEQCNTSLFVKLVGSTRNFIGDDCVCRENREAVVPALLKLNLSAKRVGHHVRFEVDEGFEAYKRKPPSADEKTENIGKLNVHATRVCERADWYYVNDRVGFVGHDPVKEISAAIQNKAIRLPEYRASAGECPERC